jgi:2'-5' RNA ligase
VRSEIEAVRTVQQHEDWRRFRSLTSMVDHWDRPGWTPHRKAYFWYLTFNSPLLRELAAKCQAEVRSASLDPVPLNGLHMTVARVGWVDEVSHRDIENLIHIARTFCSNLRPFFISVGPLAGSAGAIRFSVAPWEPIIVLRQHLLDARKIVCGDVDEETEFRPHVGIAYSNSVQPACPMIATVEALRELPPTPVPVTHVDLVALRREDHTYVWDTLGRVPLGAGA